MYRFFGFITLSLSLLLPHAKGAVLVECSQNKLASTHYCVLETTGEEQVEVGSSVIAYREGSYWAGTGKVIRMRGTYAIVEFKDYMGILHKGMSAYIYREDDLGITDWRHAFSNNEGLPYR